MNEVVYNSFARALFDGSINLRKDAIFAMLVIDYEPDKANHLSRADVMRYEVQGMGYRTGGRQLQGQVVYLDTLRDRSVFDAADLAWPDTALTAAGVILYRAGGGPPSADLLICCHQFDTEKTSSGGPFDVKWDEAGILDLGQCEGD